MPRTLDRRSFLRRLTAGATGLVLVPSAGAAGDRSVSSQAVRLPDTAGAAGRSGGAGAPDPARWSARTAEEPLTLVDPMIGTSDSRWMIFPGPSRPFGMVKLSPDNQETGWKAGYEYGIENVAGFSHIHSWTMGGLLMMPVTGPLPVERDPDADTYIPDYRRVVPGTEDDPDAGYRSRIRHEREEAHPGYYAVTLEDYDVRVELTTTLRCGVHRYTFPAEAEQRYVLFDLHVPREYDFRVREARFQRVGDTEVTGYARTRDTGWGGGTSHGAVNEYTVHFVLRFSEPFEAMGGWTGGEIFRDTDQILGKNRIGGFVDYGDVVGSANGVVRNDETAAAPAEDLSLTVTTGISLVSVEEARANLEREVTSLGGTFPSVRSDAEREWNDLLSRIEVEGARPEQRRKFYTNLYRCYTGRTTWSDASGRYVDASERVRRLDDAGDRMLGADAFWNTFWNLNQLWTLANPEYAEQWVRSLLQMYRDTGWLPKGPSGLEYTGIMVASHEIALMVAAYQKGIRGYDVQTAYEAIRHVQTTPGLPDRWGGPVGNRQLASYDELGYVPLEKGPVSNTLEYAYDDWVAGQMARALGRTEDYEMFTDRAQNYRNVFDPETRFVRPRHEGDDGEKGPWTEPFDPFSGDGFVEGNSWQYSWFVPHDLEGLADLIGGEEAFAERLDRGFRRARGDHFQSRDGFVNHGNQPNMQAAYLFNYAGKPWLTQKWARAIMNEYYGSTPTDGWPGDEDQGQMGAWYVMSAMGLFEMRGGASTEPVYDIGSPIFDRVTIHLNGDYYEGETFVIEARNNSPEHVYVQSATLNGKELAGPWFRFSEAVDGGKLVLEMGPEPNRSWGTAPADRPPSNGR